MADVSSTASSTETGTSVDCGDVIGTDIAAVIVVERLRLLRIALEAAANAILICDHSGKIVWTNPAFERLTGYSQHEALGRNPRFLKSGRHDKAFYRRMWDTILAGRVWHGEVTNRRKDGTFYLEEMTITPVLAGQGEITHFIAVKQDVTERHEAAEALARANRELEQANADMEQLVYGVSHDLKSPLVTIAGFAHYLKKDLAEGRLKQLGDYADAIIRVTEHMRTLIDDLLELSRVRRLVQPSEPVGIDDLVREVARLCEGQLAEKNVDLRIEPGLPTIRADRSCMTQLLENLLANAIRHGCTGDRPVVRVGSTAEGNEIRLFVSDGGPGIEEECQGRLFEMFYQLNRNEGTGIGLALVKRVAEQHGGRVWVESTPGRGATFWVALPEALRVVAGENEPACVRSSCTGAADR